MRQQSPHEARSGVDLKRALIPSGDPDETAHGAARLESDNFRAEVARCLDQIGHEELELLAALTDIERQVIVLTTIGGWTLKEIGAALGLDHSTLVEHRIRGYKKIIFGTGQHFSENLSHY